ncbi:MAG: hypothetical protein NTZ68_03280 [Candidatus Dependentiae bacterium]|nr:hypothetical protein [Candidatus Dependentiae bacterium]
MPQINPISQTKTGLLLHPQKTYQEIVAYLNANWKKSPHAVTEKLDQALGNLSKKLTSVIIAGTSGKSTTIHYLEKISETKSIKIGTFLSPHFISYNERFAVNNAKITNEIFTDLANQVINLAGELKLNASSKDILTAMALIYFNDQKVDLAVFEQEDMVERDPVTICTPFILGISRIVQNSPESIRQKIDNIIDHISTQTHVISANQSTLFLLKMEQRTIEKNGVWVMPIRKVAPLAYPFEQLFGRSAALADRIIQLYLEKLSVNLASGSTTACIDPKNIKTLHLSSPQFWQSINNEIPNTFQIINQKEKTILLDNASNLDAFSNLFLGIRLLNYQHSFKNIFFIVGSTKQQCDEDEFIKLFHSCFKKFSGTLSFYRATNTIAEKTGTPWDLAHLVSLAQYNKIKTAQHHNFQSAFQEISAELEDKHDLLVIAGSQAIISEYLKLAQGNNL